MGKEERQRGSQDGDRKRMATATPGLRKHAQHSEACFLTAHGHEAENTSCPDSLLESSSAQKAKCPNSCPLASEPRGRARMPSPDVLPHTPPAQGKRGKT